MDDRKEAAAVLVGYLVMAAAALVLTAVAVTVGIYRGVAWGIVTWLTLAAVAVIAFAALVANVNRKERP